MKKKVLALTGIRSEYDILYPIIFELNQSSNFEVKVAVSGAHLSEWHGFTIQQIKNDGFEIADCLDCLLMTDRVIQRAKGVGLLISSLAQTVEREKPDYILVVGDREESLAASIVGNYMNILVVHLGGGDPVYGNADDPARFAVSRLAHVHLTLCKDYAENLIKVGEQPFRVFNTGNPSLDNIRNVKSLRLDEISESINFSLEPFQYLVLIKHPLSSEKNDTYQQMKITLEALVKFCQNKKIKTVCIAPNSDPGNRDIFKAYEEFSSYKEIKIINSLNRNMFVNLIRNSLALIGNSSMGILEAPFYQKPVVNVGNRQRGRLNAGNVEFVDHHHESIVKALEKACYDESYRKHIKELENPYGDGYSSLKIRDILQKIDLTESRWYIKSDFVQ